MAGRQETRKRILDTAGALLQRNGYGGFSYQHIAAQLGLRSAAIHYHFPSQADLGVALVRRYRAGFAWWTEQLALQDVTAGERLKAFTDVEERYLREGKVCPLGVVGVEHATIPEAMRRETEVFLGELLRWLTRTLEAGRRGGEFRFHGTAEERALAFLAALQGGLQIARLSGIEGFAALVRQQLADVGLAAKPPGGRGPLAVQGDPEQYPHVSARHGDGLARRRSP